MGKRNGRGAKQFKNYVLAQGLEHREPPQSDCKPFELDFAIVVPGGLFEMESVGQAHDLAGEARAECTHQVGHAERHVLIVDQFDLRMVLL